MNNIKLLDCTLRDGGYNNDWEFGHNTLVNIFERTVSAKIDYIEIGFLDSRRTFDINRSIMPDSQSVHEIYGKSEKGNTMVVAMIDFGTCGIDSIQPCSESFIDGIRVIFKMHLMHEALAFCKQLKELGYKVFTQAVSFTTYSDEKILELIHLVNEVKPYAVSFVDTYGLMFKDNVLHYYEIIEKHLDKNIGIGYHAHNNFQLAFSNCIELANFHRNKERMLILDGSAFGMGKGAGNAPIELLAMYMNSQFTAQYDISQILESIDVNILDLYKTFGWGYSLKFFIAASNDCHPNYVQYLLDKKTLSVKSINELLQQIDINTKLLYDKTKIEKLYTEYQSSQKGFDDYLSLASALGNKKILIIGPGYSIIEEKQQIMSFIREESPLVISINFIPANFRTDYLFITNSKRYIQQLTAIQQTGSQIKLIATSNITKSTGKFDFSIAYENLIDKKGLIIDNSLVMLLKLLTQIKVQEVYIAGCDGFSLERKNFYSSIGNLEYSESGILLNNNYVNEKLAELNSEISIHFITSTKYKFQI